MIQTNFSLRYPAPISKQGSGVVVKVGNGVKNFKIGDEVYGIYVDKPMFNNPPPGFASDYALSEERFLLRKPSHVGFEDAAALIGSSVTAYQCFKRGLSFAGLEDLEGKTVYVPGALSATGSVGVQIAKHVFGAKKVISTVSTKKLPLVEKYLPGVVDQVVDYTTQDVTKVVQRGSVDFVYNTQWGNSLDQGIALANPKTGVVISIASLPGKETLREIIGADKFPVWLGLLLDVLQVLYWWKLLGTNIKYAMVSGSPNIREDMEKAGEIIALGKLKGVMTVADLDDVDKVRESCTAVLSGKGGLGTSVIRIRKSD